jgi:hypothetical protein
MRFDRRTVAGRTEFWVFDVDRGLQGALELMAWEPVAWEPVAGDATAGASQGWRRTFDAARHQVECAFQNVQRLLEPALRQSAGIDPVPWPDALAEVCARFGSAGVDWWLAGSAALAVRGAAVVPRDLDLIVSGADSRRAGDLFADGLIEPVSRAEWPLSEWWGRVFAGARIEWAGGVTPAADEPDVTDFGLTAAAALETIRWRGRDIRVPPLHLQRAVSLRRGLDSRVAIIDELLARGGAAAGGGDDGGDTAPSGKARR